MIVFDEVVQLIDGMNADELNHFIENNWIKPQEKKGTYHFTDIDIARIRLICELRNQLLVEEESLSIILSLLDQLYSTRRQLKNLLEAMQEPRSFVQ